MEIIEKAKIESLRDHIKDYINTRIEIVRLKATEKGSQAVSSLALFTILAVTGFFFILFASIAAAFAISDHYNARYLGFVIVAGFYLLSLIVFIIFRKALITDPVMNAIIRAVFKNQEKQNEQNQ